MRFEELHRLRNNLIGDELVKIELLTNLDEPTLSDLLDFGANGSFQDLKLDILFILLNLEENIRSQLGDLYIAIVDKIYHEASLPLNFKENGSMRNYKYMRLINLCIQVCPIVTYPNVNSIWNGLVYMLNKLKGDNSMWENIDFLNTIVEILSFLLHFGPTASVAMDITSPLENMLLTITDRYALDLNFKYTTRIKASKSSPLNTRYNVIANKGIEASTYLPNPVYIKNPVDCLLFSLGLAIYPCIFNKSLAQLKHRISLWNNTDFNIFVKSFLKSREISLRCAALTYLISPYFEQEDRWQQKKALQLYLPYLVDCLNFTEFPWWFDPFENLTLLIDLYHKHEPLNNIVIGFLAKTNVMYGILTLFAQCLSLKTQNRASMNCTTKFIRLCASFAAYDELYRTLLLEQKNILHQLEYGLNSHLNLLKDFLKHKDVLLKLDGPELLNLPPIYDHETVMAWLLLLKSFSRSVSALRTSLKSNKLAELLLELLRTTYKILQECEFAGKDFLNAEIEIMGVNLGCICNFVVEFSNLQSFMLKNGIVETTGHILNNPLFNSKRLLDGAGHHNILDKNCIDAVKANALWVLRHLMYNCQNTEKMELLSEIPMSTILEFINDSSWSVQEQCFQLIRNLTCNSRKVVNILLENFQNVEYKNDQIPGSNLVKGSTYLFEYLARKMILLSPKDMIQRKTLEGVLYIIVNLAAVNENKKELVIEQMEILNIIREILSESSQKVGHYNNDSKLKLASLWVLNNLLWDSSISRYTHFALEGYAPSQNDEQPKNEDPSWHYYQNDTSNPAIQDEEVFENDSEYEDDTKEDEEDTEEFVHGTGLGTASGVHTNRAAIERCKKLVNIGIYDLVKQNIFEDSLSVREKARTLLYHMDLLLKDAV